MEVLALMPGESASRNCRGGPWTRQGGMPWPPGLAQRRPPAPCCVQPPGTDPGIASDLARVSVPMPAGPGCRCGQTIAATSALRVALCRCPAHALPDHRVC